MAFETARALRDRFGIQPKGLFVSGCRAPHIPDLDAPIHQLPEHLFIPAIGRLNGTPAAVLENKELLALMLPILRADFQAIEQYVYRDGVSLSCAITAISGTDDPKASSADMLGWEVRTTGGLEHHEVEGDHFFVHQEQFPLMLRKLVDQV